MNHNDILKAIDDSSNDIISFLRSIIRFDTTNPPGNELPLAQYIYDFMSREGIDCEVIESMDGRGNIIANIPGEYESKRILYLSHLDVVPAGDISRWSHNPFSADFDGEWIYGRGALDCKGLVASQVLSLVMLKRLGIKPKYTLILASTADEETGGWRGIGWIASKYPGKVKANYVINEGGGLPIKGKNNSIVYLVDVCEKGSCNVKIRISGKSGHSSVPFKNDNALYMMGLVIKRLYEYTPPKYRCEIVKDSFNVIFKSFAGTLGSIMVKLLFSPFHSLAFKFISRSEPNMANFIRSLMGLTMAPTIAESGEKENVIPNSAEIIVNCRLLPGQDENYVLSVLRGALSIFKNVEIEVLGCSHASYSVMDQEFFNIMNYTLKSILGEYNTHLVPFVMPGSSDSRFLRVLGAKVYGFSPYNPKLNYSELMNLAHGVNEKIDVNSLILSTKFLTLLPLNINL